MVAGMDQDHEAKANRLEEQARTRDAANPAKPKPKPKPKPDEIDPERLRKAVRYLREHPEQQASASDF
jgi:hypothetical protein